MSIEISAEQRYKDHQNGVETMCRAFDEVREQGRERGLEQGRELTQIENIRNLMENLKMTAQQAMDALGIPMAEQEKLLVKVS